MALRNRRKLKVTPGRRKSDWMRPAALILASIVAIGDGWAPVVNKLVDWRIAVMKHEAHK